MRAAVYVRISRNPDGTSEAPTRQLEDCRRYVETRGWTLAETFVDDDVSAFRRVRRPGFDALIAAIKAGEIDAVVCWRMDRLARQTRDLVRLSDVCEAARASIIGVADGVDTSTTAGRFVSELLVAMAKQESANTSLRVKRAQLDAARRGRPKSGGRRLFGYEKGRHAIIEPEAALVREAVERVILGQSLRSIATDWHARGVLTSFGNAWQPPILRRLVMSPAIAGLQEVDGALVRGEWPAIITEAQHRRAYAIVTDPSRRNTGLGAPRSYLLTGIIHCAKCGVRLVGRVGSDGRRRYICTRRPGVDACAGVARIAVNVEDTVKAMLIEATRGVNIARLLVKPAEVDTAGLAEVVRADEEALTALAHDHYVARLIGRAEFISARAALTARLEANRRQLATTTGAGVMAGVLDVGAELEARWDAESLQWRREVVETLVERVTLASAGRGRPFSPELVAVVWKF